jgi:hypothetical protein
VAHDKKKALDDSVHALHDAQDQSQQYATWNKERANHALLTQFPRLRIGCTRQYEYVSPRV